MKKEIGLWQFGGFAVASLLGTLFHYLYEWSGKNLIVATFSGVNESTWEHMKLLFFPLALFCVFERLFFTDVKNYWCIKLVGILVGSAFIPTVFYTCNGAFGKSPDWFNILIFYLAAATVFIVETRLFLKNNTKCRFERLSAVLIIAVAIAFVFFTFYPPHLPLFKDPITNTFGI